MVTVNIVLPRIENVAATRNYGRFTIGPLESGFGVTLGNALRRVLLSSLAGAAITAVRIDGVYHKFSTIEPMQEDVIGLILNLKQVRLRSQTEEQVRLSLHMSGPGIVTAGDIDCPPEVEIVNPEQYLCTLDSGDVELEMELLVDKGRGYSPAEERGKLAVGEIPMDAIFSPVRRTSFSVERERVGQLTNYDRLIMEIWTDGTIDPQEALARSAGVLLHHFSLIAGLEEGVAGLEEEEEEGIPTRIYETPIEELGLSVRAYNCLKRAGITRVGEILERLQQGEEHMLSIRNFGRKSLDELYEQLEAKGFYERAGSEEGQVQEAGETQSPSEDEVQEGGQEDQQ